MGMRKIIVAMMAVMTGLAGCTSSQAPTFGNSILGQSQDSRMIGEKWNKGNSSMIRGEKLQFNGQKKVEQGRSMVKDGQDNISKGKELVLQGEQLKQESETEYRIKFPEGKSFQ